MSAKTKNPYLLTLPELISAKKKISKVAAFYDPSKKGLQGFDSSALDATEFREQLRRNFLVKLTDAELGAIVFLFDQDGDRQVDSVEFINEFLRLGNLEKSRLRFEAQEAAKKIEKLKEKEAEKARKKQEKLTSIKIATSWTPEDEESAVAKIAHVAFTYDSMKGGLSAFLNAEALTQSEFKEQLRRVFNIHLTPEETAALTHIYDKYHNGEVDTKEFVYHFFRTRRSELDYHQSRQNYMTEQKNALDKQRLEEAKERFAKMTIAKTTPCTEEERQSALDKIRLAAAWYRKSPFIDAIQKSFEAEELAPTAFKELLFNNFEIRLSPGELDAVVKLFDHNCDGNISCVEFMTTFHKIGSEERMRILNEKRRKDHQIAMAEKERRRQMDENIKALTMTKVKWPELPAFEEDVELASKSTKGDPLMGESTLSQTHFRKRKSRKASTIDILAPDKFAAKLANTNRSFTELYPKASDSTKSFIMELESKEREIRSLNASNASLRSIGTLSTKDNRSSNDSQGSGGGGGGNISETSSTATGTSAHKASRRISKKAPVDNGTRATANNINQRPPIHAPEPGHYNVQSHGHHHHSNHPYGANAAAAHAMMKSEGGGGGGIGEMSRQSTASTVYSEYDSFDPHTSHSLPSEGATLPRSNTGFGEPYVEVEATLPPIEFDRPRTVHSYSRPGSSRSQTLSRGNDSGFEKL